MWIKGKLACFKIHGNFKANTDIGKSRFGPDHEISSTLCSVEQGILSFIVDYFF